MSTDTREKFSSRLGFILVAAGCAIGLGNVWKFPYLCGQNGGAAFILIYLLCLGLLAFPILVCELSVGRASQKSSARAFHILEPKGSRWHLGSYMCIAGTYLLMMFYTCVCGWMLYYFFKYLSGQFAVPGLTPAAISSEFAQMLADPTPMTISTLVVIITAFVVCSFGVQKGIEKVTKYMMLGLLGLITLLAIHALTLPGAEAGIQFYLIPDFDRMIEKGIGNVLFDAMSQAFFTLSIGIGAMVIFGSYLNKKRSLTSEGAVITLLDTIVAIMAGLIIIPACFAFGIEPDAGPSLIFITMPNVFDQMSGGQIWGTCFFLFLLFAALSTIIAIFENIIAYAIDLWGWSRKKAIFINFIILSLGAIPCILGFNVLSDIQPLGPSTSILDLEDFLVSNNFLPLGALLYLLFCIHKNGWGWSNFLKETNTGKGLLFPKIYQPLLRSLAPFMIVLIYLKGYYDKFSQQGPLYLTVWLGIALLFLAFVTYVSFGRRRKQKAEDC